MSVAIESIINPFRPIHKQAKHMASITTKTYEEFIRGHFRSFNYDGTILIDNLKELVMTEFGSSPRIVDSHINNLVFLKLLERLSFKVMRLNFDKFSDFKSKEVSE